MKKKAPKKPKAEEYLAGWQRCQADFENYKKQETERVKKLLEYGAEDVALKILPILDNFELVEKNLPKELKDNDYIKGILQIKFQIQDILKSQGVEEIKGVGERFNPNLHEVIKEVEVKNKASGIITEEVQKGYKLNDKVIRPSKVKITK